MGYLIRMVSEVGEWLAAVRERDPAAADLIDEAVAALGAGGQSVGPPLVVPLDDPSLRARPDLDAAYERQLELQTRVRRGAATLATSRKRLQLETGQLEQQIGNLTEQAREAGEEGRADRAEEADTQRDAAQRRLADLRRQGAEMRAEEERVFVASQRLQAKVTDFRTRKEALKAAYTAAQAEADAAWVEAVIDDASADTLGTRPAAVDAVNTERPDPPRPWLQLSELRPGACGSDDTRILFTVEPPGTAVLLAASTESDRLRAWYSEAMANCRIRYRREQRSR